DDAQRVVAPVVEGLARVLDALGHLLELTGDVGDGGVGVHVGPPCDQLGARRPESTLGRHDLRTVSSSMSRSTGLRMMSTPLGARDGSDVEMTTGMSANAGSLRSVVSTAFPSMRGMSRSRMIMRGTTFMPRRSASAS